jgi:hypothetical protein
MLMWWRRRPGCSNAPRSFVMSSGRYPRSQFTGKMWPALRAFEEHVKIDNTKRLRAPPMSIRPRLYRCASSPITNGRKLLLDRMRYIGTGARPWPAQFKLCGAIIAQGPCVALISPRHE